MEALEQQEPFINGRCWQGSHLTPAMSNCCVQVSLRVGRSLDARSRRRGRWPNGNCAIACCTNSFSDHATAKALIHLKLRELKPSTPGNSAPRSLASRSMTLAPQPSACCRSRVSLPIGALSSSSSLKRMTLRTPMSGYSMVIDCRDSVATIATQFLSEGIPRHLCSRLLPKCRGSNERVWADPTRISPLARC